MALTLSKRADLIVQSEIRNMSIECDRVGGINLSQGICDLEVPLPVRRGAQAAMDAGINQYTRYDGLASLRTAIAGKLRDYNGITADPESQIIVSAGATGALYCTCLALLNPGDEVIIFEPYYGYHVNTLLAANVTPVSVTLTPPDWTFDLRQLEAAVTPRTRGILICTPSNPTGKVFSRAELEGLSDFCTRHDLFVFTDEIYEYFIYDGRTHVSPGSLPSLADRTITISGYSKTFSITGWRIGYAVCPLPFAQMIGYMNDLVYVCSPAPLQQGVAEGIQVLPPAFYRDLCNTYLRKRNRICEALARCGLSPYVPQGAYYVLANVSRVPGRTAKERAMHILQQVGVASVPGSAFCRTGGEDMVRFCFAKDEDVLDEACQRLARL